MIIPQRGCYTVLKFALSNKTANYFKMQSHLYFRYEYSY